MSLIIRFIFKYIGLLEEKIKRAPLGVDNSKDC